MTSKDFVEVGQVAGVHGIRGAVLLRSFAENPDIFAKGGKILVKGPGENLQEFILESSRPHKGKLLAELQGVSDRNGAEALKGRMILVHRDALPEPEPGEYYWIDLIGMEVAAPDGARLGVLDSIIETGANDVYVIKDGEKEILAPALPWVVLSIDLEAGVMTIDLPEGL
ncbi:16S rRNA processing protein RimM [Desulfatibacillum alkenivorans DSM 16219]|jgi:16S rRNA processing protein RimM|uniref:Ribosome maturation factor RimM n=1 Tax=Desulfatibacillum alkenivorans DSM 16219 TaxID=1121393 RepID=A0A1M6R4M3_9BACT|nr:ribosome maturation factor RimM [Desulfatibacillum alkenivorans]SHK27350.1 16S rRNA processing protein RimM [Desulfatibacillum alkenivorans DSM 16219]